MTKKKFDPEELFGLPEEIFVYRQQDGGDTYLVTNEELAEAVENSDKGTVIGTYTLNHLAKYAIKKEITEVK
jgi:hypothetical protein